MDTAEIKYFQDKLNLHQNLLLEEIEILNTSISDIEEWRTAARTVIREALCLVRLI